MQVGLDGRRWPCSLWHWRTVNDVRRRVVARTLGDEAYHVGCRPSRPNPRRKRRVRACGGARDGHVGHLAQVVHLLAARAADVVADTVLGA
eukprot:scaffold59603_cov35-Tisochrysis_lutea.AAC.3